MESETNNLETTTVVADHIVGTMLLTMGKDVGLSAMMFDKLSPENMRLGANTEPAIVYGEMARLFQDPNEPYSFGALEHGLTKLGFNFDYIAGLQARIEPETPKTMSMYAERVNNAAGLFILAQNVNEAREAISEPHASADDVKASLISSLTKSQSTGTSVHTSMQVGERLKQDLENMKNGLISGRKTGIDAFDRVFSLEPGFLITLGMRPSQGKTSTQLQLLFNVARAIKESGEKAQVVFFTADDTELKGMERMVCAQAGIDSRKLRANKLSQKEWRIFNEWMDYISTLPIFWDETPTPTGEHIYYRSAMLSAHAPIALGCMDYVQLMKSKSARSKTEQVENSFISLKATAKVLEFPMLAASQLGKRVEEYPDKFPTVSDMLYAGEAESEIVITGVRPEHYISRGEDIVCEPRDQEGVIVFNVGKNKNGLIGKVRLGYKKEWTRIFDLQSVNLNDLTDEPNRKRWES